MDGNQVLNACSNVQRAADLLGLHWNSMHAIIERGVERGLERRDLDNLEHVGMDEKSFGKGHDYVSVMTDIDNKRVLEVVPERTIKSAAKAREGAFAVRNQRFRLVGRDKLYDMENDPSQKTNVIAEHSEVGKQMNDHYDKWFTDALPNMVNEDAPLEGHNTFHLMYWKQYNMEIPPVNKRGF